MISELSDNERRISAVTGFSAPYDVYHDRHQAYYIAGLREALAGTDARVTVRPLQRFPALMRTFRRVRSSHRLSPLMQAGIGPLMDRVVGRMGGLAAPPFAPFHSLVGQYEFVFADRRRVRLFLDAQAQGEIPAEAQVENCDVYAKSTFRKETQYPGNVVPLCMGNPVILPHLAKLRQLRRRAPEYDLCFVVRVWGGRDEEEGVEHNLRLLEAVNKARCEKLLLAYLVAGDIETQEARLKAQGIPTTRTPVPLSELWDISANSRLNLIRLGMHNCIPWRFMDLLAMGACPLFDQVPQTQWSAPLVEGTQYLHLGATTTPDHPLAVDAAYDEIPAKIEELVRDAGQSSRIRASAADYFDRHACPAAIGRQLLAYSRAACRAAMC